MSSILITSESVAALAEIATQFIALLTEIHKQNASDADEAWKDTVTAYQAAAADWEGARQRLNAQAGVLTVQPPTVNAPSASPVTPVATSPADRSWRL